MTADTAGPPASTPSPALALLAASAVVPVVPTAKMRSRAALYRAERSAKVPLPAALIGAAAAAAAEGGELGLELGPSLASASPPFF
jgi:hypothetical protein